jgi:glycosyltransferase involved in cell wall biosynthesis
VISHAVHKSKAIIAVSEYTKNSILKHFPSVDPHKIQVIHEGVTSLAKAEQETTSTLTLPPNPYFLYVGNAYPHKNLEALLHAFSFFHQIHPEVTLVLAGRSDVFYDRLKQEVDEIEIPSDRVKFIMSPSDHELHELYRHASLYLFPSRIEGFGLPPLEAMQEGVPVAAARAGSLPEILGDAAIYFHPDDIEEMVRVMEQTLVDEALRKDLKKKGAKQITRYSWQVMTKTILSLYDTLE